MQLWGGRFQEKMDADAWALNTSLSFDRRLAKQDVLGSIAWARALQKAQVLNQQEMQQTISGLEKILTQFEDETFEFLESDEDIHTAVERRLGELIGEVAGKLHSGRSRNDQVATDFRLWLLQNLPLLDSALEHFQHTLIQRAETDFGLIMSGYTHLQRAQPLLLSHWWLSYFWGVVRDRQRLQDARKRLAWLPLGCGALAGTSYNIDRIALANELGFDTVAYNSIDAVSDRDFAAEFLFVAALIGVHLSRLAEAVILFSTAEFGFFELADAFSTGSSLMPQKKNPDVFELTRAKAGVLLGKLTGLLAILKGLPSTYDKDLQEDKQPVFQAYDTLMLMLPVISQALDTIKVNTKRMREVIDDGLLATDLADYLVLKRVPFREAHRLVGAMVRLASEKKLSLSQLPVEDYQQISAYFSADVYGIYNPERSIAKRRAVGGTAPEAVQEQIKTAKIIMGKLNHANK